MRESSLGRLLDEANRRLDGFDAHGIASEEFRRSVYSLYEILRGVLAAMREVESEFQDAYEAFRKIAERQETIRTRELLGSIIEAADEESKKSDAQVGNYL